MENKKESLKELKEAKYYKKLKDTTVQCNLCPKHCVIKNNETGDCRVRKNIDGILYNLNYGHPSSIAIDPIEKKPLYHFLPGSKALSIGGYGCNMHCLNCQNYEISQNGNVDLSFFLEPKKIVELAIENNCESIAYTYNEPTVFFEYALDIAKIAREKGLKNLWISNGFINEEPLKELLKYIDAANIDLKVYNNKKLKELTTARLDPILKTLKIIKESNVWLEITRLVIPGYSDDSEEFEESCRFIKEQLGDNTPLHITRFYPMYKLNNLNPTPIEKLHEFRDIAKKYLKYVYLGNIREESNTICPKCGYTLIERNGYSIKADKEFLSTGICPKCKTKIDGLWSIHNSTKK
ncbi:MAG: AmmeMemoRadiSam system radical SAM enzyme [Nitrospiraceae bacterium]|nr:AmmeMemoRadiSam system radical SAM enzyme [Nitrospiraceae bacterium]